MNVLVPFSLGFSIWFCLFVVVFVFASVIISLSFSPFLEQQSNHSMLGVHASAWAIIHYGYIARKQSLTGVCLDSLSRYAMTVGTVSLDTIIVIFFEIFISF